MKIQAWIALVTFWCACLLLPVIPWWASVMSAVFIAVVFYCAAQFTD